MHTKFFGSVLFLGAALGGTASANFIVAENGTTAGSVEVYSPTGTPIGTFASGLSTPIGVTEGGGNVFVSQYGADTITKYSTTGTNLGVMNNQAGGHGPTGIVYQNGRVVGAAHNINALTAITPDVGSEDGNRGTPSTYLFYEGATPSVHGVTSGVPNGFANYSYYTSSGANGSGALGYYAPGVDAGEITTFAAGSSPRGIVSAGSNIFYVALNQADKVVKVESVNGLRVTTDFITGIDAPVGVVIDNGNLYVSSFTGKTITGYSLANGMQTSQFNTLNSPQYFAVTNVTVPEPATLGLAGLAAVGLLGRRRRTA